MSPGATLQVSSIPTTPSFLTEYMISCKIFNYGANVRNSWSSREQVAIFLIILSSPERLREIKEVVAIFRISSFNLKVKEWIWNTNTKDQTLQRCDQCKIGKNIQFLLNKHKDKINTNNSIWPWFLFCIQFLSWECHLTCKMMLHFVPVPSSPAFTPLCSHL